MDSLGVRVGTVGSGATARPRRTAACDRCAGSGVWHGERCDLCDGDGRRDLHIFELRLDTRDVDERDPLTAAVEARDRSGSYRDLELALAGVRVHVNKPARYRVLTGYASEALRLVAAVHVARTRTVEDLSAGERWLLDLTIGYLESRMPEPIRVPPDVAANARLLRERRTRAKGRSSHPAALAQRDRELRQHHRAGRSVQWLAAEYGLSIRTVYETLNGAPA